MRAFPFLLHFNRQLSAHGPYRITVNKIKHSSKQEENHKTGTESADFT